MSKDIQSSSRGEHAALLYKNNSERETAALDYINQGLRENRLCIYASVGAYDQLHLSRISSKIVDFKENIDKRNLLIVNLKPVYDSALEGDLTPLENLKKQIQQELERRNNKSVTIVADCADNLFQNQYFDQSQLVESWWHRAYMEWIRYDNNKGRQQHDVTIVCPHRDLLLYKHPFNQHMYKILDNHSVTIDMAGHTIITSSTLDKQIEVPPLRPTEPTNCQMEYQTHILIAEPDPELRSVYGMWLRSRGFKSLLVTDSGSRCLEEVVRIRNVNQRSNVIVIFDSHLRDISFIELAKQIINIRPDQILILTTTLSSINVNIDSNIKVLVKPFKLSKLLPLIVNSG